jgi:hypothetical protein
MSAGSLMQLVALGAQDRFLTSNNRSNITFFKQQYNKFTNVAYEYDTTKLTESNDLPKCILCNCISNNGKELFTTLCNHIFHKKCINKHMNTFFDNYYHCPECHINIDTSSEHIFTIQI